MAKARPVLAVVAAACLMSACTKAPRPAPAARPSPAASPSAGPSAATPSPAATPTPAQGPVALGRGRTVLIKDDFGSGGVVTGTVTAHTFRDHVAAGTPPAEAGDHWAAVDVTACVTRRITLPFSGWALFDDGGVVEQATRLRSAGFPRPALPADLAVGCHRGWLTFEVADGAVLVVFALVQSSAQPPPAWQLGG